MVRMCLICCSNLSKYRRQPARVRARAATRASASERRWCRCGNGVAVAWLSLLLQQPPAPAAAKRFQRAREPRLRCGSVPECLKVDGVDNAGSPVISLMLLLFCSGRRVVLDGAKFLFEWRAQLAGAAVMVWFAAYRGR